MSKYNYDSKALKGLGVGPFLNEVKLRDSEIAKGENSIPTSIFNPNIVSVELHPAVQFGVVNNIIEHRDAKTYVIGPNEKMGTEKLAYFRAGQYVSVVVEPGDGAFLTRPYSLCSNPKDAFKGIYEITIKKKENGYASDYILNNWKVGKEITLSGPLGQFYFERLRDAKNIVAVAGGSGITPFVSMAKAIVEGTEDFNLTILYGSRKYEDILLRDELSDVEAKSNGKIKVVHVLSDEDKQGYEHGFIGADLIKKYAKDDYSVFICGPKAMYKFLETELPKLNLPRRRIRQELAGEYGDPTKDSNYPDDRANKEYKVKVWIKGEVKELTCKAENTLMSAIEKAGIKVTTDCRSGVCGWCHSRLIKGDVYIPESHDGRRLADKKFGWIHPCATYPLSNIEIEVFPNF